MAVLDVNLVNGEETVVNSANASDGDVVSVNVLGSGTLVVDGVHVTLADIVPVGALSSPTFAAQNGGSLTIDQGLLGVQALNDTAFEVRDSGTITLDASAIDLGLVSTLLNEFSVNYTGESHTGSFVYEPPGLSILPLAPQRFQVAGMQATDRFTIAGRSNLALAGDTGDAYQNGILRLVSTAALSQTVTVEIPMTQAEFDLFLDDQDSYLSGGTFIFPGQLAVPCFTRGTLIATPSGEIAIERLRVGDLVLTRDHGAQPIRWIGMRRLGERELAANGKLRPIRIASGALGGGLPAADLTVSPQHRILVRSKIAQRMFGQAEVLVAARQLLQVEGIDVVEGPGEVTYFHVLFDRHEVILANGAEAESFYTGPNGLRAMPPAAREEILAILPELAAGDHQPQPARALLPGRAARRMVARHLRNGRVLLSPPAVAGHGTALS